MKTAFDKAPLVFVLMIVMSIHILLNHITLQYWWKEGCNFWAGTNRILLEAVFITCARHFNSFTCIIWIWIIDSVMEEGNVCCLLEKEGKLCCQASHLGSRLACFIGVFISWLIVKEDKPFSERNCHAEILSCIGNWRASRDFVAEN